MKKLPLSYFEISSENLLHNIKVLKSIIPGRKFISVIKANAYGHGQNEVAEILEPHTDYFQVDDIEELRLLRKVSKKSTLVFGYVQVSDLEEVVKLKGILSLYDEKRMFELEKISKKINKKIPVHVKIDSFTGRQGVLLESLPQFISELKKCKHIHVAGVYSHFVNIEDSKNSEHAKKQIVGFESAIESFRNAGYKNFETHISATSGLLAFENKISTTTVRLGIGLYGMWPSSDLEKLWKNKIQLKPVGKWVTHIAQVKKIPKWYSVGYGLTYIAKKETTIAIIPQGYGDGFDRGFSSCGEVLIGSKKVKVIGRVMMNMIVADVSSIKNVKQEDEVILLGSQGENMITAEEMAKKLGTINYEITTRISPLLPKIIT